MIAKQRGSNMILSETPEAATRRELILTYTICGTQVATGNQMRQLRTSHLMRGNFTKPKTPN